MADVTRHDDLSDFWSLTSGFFSADPVFHTIAITAVTFRLGRVLPPDETPLLVSVTDNGELVAAALRTPPFPLVVSGVAAEWAPVLADALADVELPGVSGPREEAEAFVLAWTERTGHRAWELSALRLFRLGDLEPPDGVPGTARRATEADADVLARWHHDFIDESVPREPDRAGSREYVERSMEADAGHVLWVRDDEPVAWASAGRPQAAMSRIGPVYTPPEHRTRGYGSAVTAACARWALDAGAEHVVLFTDLANPISNSIYRRIGFRPVHDAAEFAFAAP